jgi:threonine/homoserine/homoserine lactone efflux protein
MYASTLVLFASATLLLNLTPGPDMLYCLSRSLGQGWKGSAAAATGNLAGSLVHTAFVVTGLSAILVASSTAFLIVKLAGAAYLVYLGVRVLLTRGVDPHAAARPPASFARVARESFVIHTLNPKTAVFFLAFLPQFVDPAAPGPALQLAILGLWFTVQAALVLLVIGLIAAWAGGRLRVSERVGLWMRRATGALFIAFGLRLVLSARQ